ncbi:hypothetical protein [Nocardia sp. bgisy118]|uniref:hypothetical protein n=1 Tax=Nocardia sp. bgisy118 TaxID=3413786 RepID=UPI003F4A3270
MRQLLVDGRQNAAGHEQIPQVSDSSLVDLEPAATVSFDEGGGRDLLGAIGDYESQMFE